MRPHRFRGKCVFLIFRHKTHRVACGTRVGIVARETMNGGGYDPMPRANRTAVQLALMCEACGGGKEGAGELKHGSLEVKESDVEHLSHGQ